MSRNIDDDAMDAVREAAESGEVIEGWTARVIAGWWHPGMMSAAYAYSSSGHCDRVELLGYFARELRNAPPESRDELHAILGYLHDDDCDDDGPWQGGDFIEVRTYTERLTWEECDCDEDDCEAREPVTEVVDEDRLRFDADDCDDDETVADVVAYHIHSQGGRLEGGDWWQTEWQAWTHDDYRDGATRQQTWHVPADRFAEVADAYARLISSRVTS